MTAQKRTVLVADDDRFIRDDLSELLAGEHRILTAATAAETWQCVSREHPDLVLLDIKFPDSQDLGLLQRIRTERPGVEVIVLSSQTSDLSLVVEAIKLGAYDYIGKPFVPEELVNRVNRALELHQARRNQERLLQELEDRSGIEGLVGSSETMSQLRQSIRRLAAVDGCVLFQGESGTGKELGARALHLLSRRRAAPFVVVNCSSIPEQLVESVLFGHRKGAFTGAVDNSRGRFEAAEDGSIFLDEIGDMPLSQQSSLLRVLEYRRFTPVGESRERECRARFILATNRDLRERVRDGTFREDLFFRIRVATVQMPPLRTHLEDIEGLVACFLDRLCAEMGRRPVRAAPEVLELFKQYDWPGNVRELKNVLEGALMLGEEHRTELRIQDLPAELLAVRVEGTSGAECSPQERQEREDLVRALQQSGWNQTRTAKLLGVHRNTIRARIRYFGLTGMKET